MAQSNNVSNIKGGFITKNDQSELVELGQFARETYNNVQKNFGDWKALSFRNSMSGETSFNGLNNFMSGFQAHAWANKGKKEIVFAISGTNDLLDVAKWGSGMTGTVDSQVKDTVKAGREIYQLVHDKKSPYYGYDVKVTGHSLGGELAQVAAYTFGWDGASYDGPGAAHIVNSNDFKKFLSSEGIKPAGRTGAEYMNVKVGVDNVSGGGVVAMAGENVNGISKQFYTNGDGVKAVTALEKGVTAATMGLGWLGAKVVGGTALHNVTTITQDIKDGNVTNVAQRDMSISLVKSSNDNSGTGVPVVEYRNTNTGSPNIVQKVVADVGSAVQNTAGSIFSGIWSAADAVTSFFTSKPSSGHDTLFNNGITRAIGNFFSLGNRK